MRGRKKLPTQLRIIEGNRSHRPIPTNEPKPDARLPRCPKHLDDEGKRAYYRLAHYLHDLGIMADIYRDFLAAAAQGYSNWVEISEKLKLPNQPPYFLIEQKTRKDGTLYGGHPFANPLLRLQRHALEQMKTFGIEFGLSPSAMTRIIGNANPTVKANEADPAKKYFG